MTDPLVTDANAISPSSPKIRTYAQHATQRIIDLEAKVAALAPPTPTPAPTPTPTPPPAPAPVYAQHYTAADMQALLTAGALVRVADDRIVRVDDTHVRFTVKPGDQYSTWSGERAQIQPPGQAGSEGDRYHWRVPFMLEAGFPYSPGFYNVIWQHHHNGSTGSPPFTVQLHAERVVMRVTLDASPGNNWTELDLGAAKPGIPQLLDVDCLLSSDTTKARTVCTLDGNGPVSATGHRNIYVGSSVYPIWGLYRAPATVTQVVTFGVVERYAT